MPFAPEAFAAFDLIHRFGILLGRYGALAGFIIFGIRDDGGSPYGVIYDLGVLPGFREKGTGSLLVRTALDYFREQRVESCFLESGVNNPSAHHFFEQFGFRQVSCVFRNKL